MNREEVNFIQESLGITLPKVYIDTLLNYPFERFAGTCQWPISDNPNEVVDLTTIYRTRKHAPTWDEQFICVGNDGATAPYFYNVSTGEVIQDDKGHKTTQLASFSTFEDFLHYLEKVYAKTNWAELEIEREANEILGKLFFWGLVLAALLVIGFCCLF